MRAVNAIGYQVGERVVTRVIFRRLVSERAVVGELQLAVFWPGNDRGLQQVAVGVQIVRQHSCGGSHDQRLIFIRGVLIRVRSRWRVQQQADLDRCRVGDAVEDAVGVQITTIEGLSENGDHPVQKAWLDEHVTQCGYCQPGQILNAVALLEKNPKPTDEDINAAMKNVLCRCGTYQRIRKAIHKAAEKGG